MLSVRSAQLCRSTRFVRESLPHVTVDRRSFEAKAAPSTCTHRVSPVVRSVLSGPFCLRHLVLEKLEKGRSAIASLGEGQKHEAEFN